MSVNFRRREKALHPLQEEQLHYGQVLGKAHSENQPRKAHDARERQRVYSQGLLRGDNAEQGTNETSGESANCRLVRSGLLRYSSPHEHRERKLAEIAQRLL